MSTPSDTPRTDAILESVGGSSIRPNRQLKEHAFALERELTAGTATIAGLTEERDEATQKWDWYHNLFCPDHDPEEDESWTQYSCPLCETARCDRAAVLLANERDSLRSEVARLTANLASERTASAQLKAQTALVERVGRLERALREVLKLNNPSELLNPSITMIATNSIADEALNPPKGD